MLSRISMAAAAVFALSMSTPVLAHDFEVADIAIGHPWTRATAPNAPVAGAYMTLDNHGDGDDRLVGGSTPVAESVEIHRMTMNDGVMQMRELEDGLALPAGETVALEPGGYHIMLIGLSERIEEGTLVPLTLRFEKAGEVEVELAVEAMGARTSAGADHGSEHGDHGMSDHEAMGHGSGQ